MKRARSRFGANIYWIAAFIGAAVFSVAMLFGVLFASSNYSSVRLELESGYKQSFFEMADSVSDIEINLSKMLVSVSDEQTIEIAEGIRIQSQMAQNSLNRIPTDVETAHGINKFLNQVGDWCASYCHALLTNGETSVYEDGLEEIYTVTKRVNDELGIIASTFKSGNQSIISSLKREGIKNVGELSFSYDSLKHSVIEYPQLIYDGPFSDREGEPCFKALDSLEPIDEATAKAKAMEIFKEQKIDNIKFLTKSSRPSCYEFSGTIKGGNIYFSISERGGKLISATTDLTPSTPTNKLGGVDYSLKNAQSKNSDDTNQNASIGKYSITKDKAKQLAVSYAERCEYCEHLSPVWYNSIDGVAYVNLAPIIDGVIYYPDLVKVKIGLDDGKLIGIESTGFCTNNCVRTSKPQIDEKTAKGSVSPKLDITSCRLAVIPLEGSAEKEKLCYEIISSYKQLNYYVYVDALSGKQVKILRQIDEPQGEMVL